MSCEVAFQLLIRVSILSCGAWLVLLAMRRCSGSVRAAAAGCGLAACLLVPVAMPFTKQAASAEPVVVQAEQTYQTSTPLTESSKVIVSQTDQVGAEKAPAPLPFDMFGFCLFASVASLLVMRLGIGVVRASAISRRARRDSVLGHPVRISDELVSPMTVMVRTVVVPSEIISWPEAQVRPILDHELAHARRLDAVSMAVSSLISAALWPVPFVWLLRRELVRAIEDAADDQVIAGATDPLTYAETLRRACEAFRTTPAHAATFARKPMISSRIERTLMTSVDRRKIGRLPLFALAGAAILAAGASAQGLLVDAPEPAPPALKNGPAQVEVVQLQTMDKTPVYWKPDGTKIASAKAIKADHGLKRGEGDVVIWIRVKDPKESGHLWVQDVSGFFTNGGRSFWKDGWCYSASRIAVHGRSLPAKGKLEIQYSVGDYRSLGDYLTASMITKREGKNSAVSVGEHFKVSKWGSGPHKFGRFEGKKVVEYEVRQAFFVDFSVDKNLGTGGHGLKAKLKNPSQKHQSSVLITSGIGEDWVTYRYWLDVKAEDIDRLSVVTRDNHYETVSGVALRPKS